MVSHIRMLKWRFELQSLACQPLGSPNSPSIPSASRDSPAGMCQIWGEYFIKAFLLSNYNWITEVNHSLLHKSMKRGTVVQLAALNIYRYGTVAKKKTKQNKKTWGSHFTFSLNDVFCISHEQNWKHRKGDVDPCVLMVEYYNDIMKPTTT